MSKETIHCTKNDADSNIYQELLAQEYPKTAYENAQTKSEQ